MPPSCRRRLSAAAAAFSSVVRLGAADPQPLLRPPSAHITLPISPAGATLLAAVDDRVDKALVSTQKVVSDNAAFLTQQIQKQKEFHAQNLEATRLPATTI